LDVARNAANPRIGSGMQQARRSWRGESRRGGEKPRGRNGIREMVAPDRRSNGAREGALRLGVDALWLCRWRGRNPNPRRGGWSESGPSFGVCALEGRQGPEVRWEVEASKDAGASWRRGAEDLEGPSAVAPGNRSYRGQDQGGSGQHQGRPIRCSSRTPETKSQASELRSPGLEGRLNPTRVACANRQPRALENL